MCSAESPIVGPNKNTTWLYLLQFKPGLSDIYLFSRSDLYLYLLNRVLKKSELCQKAQLRISVTRDYLHLGIKSQNFNGLKKIQHFNTAASSAGK